MDDLIAALLIFRKYASKDALMCPTHCEHDELTVMVSPEDVPVRVKKELERLGFFENGHNNTFYSFRFGSA